MSDEPAILKKNMALWNTVSKTNPKHTKKVKFGREFTAIDPHSQIQAATGAFGAAGRGWGWNIERVEYPSTNEIAVLVRLWHGERDCTIEQWGQCGLYIDKNDTRKDSDCFKKATTDGLTKCLSYLGFNADVFLGKFDDSKYVKSMENEYAEVNDNPNAPTLDNNEVGSLNTLISAFDSCKKDEEVDKLFTDNQTFMKKLKDGGYKEYSSVANAYKKAKARAKGDS